jgi:hypothetical protein
MSVSHKRRVVSYLRPKAHFFTTNMSKVEEISVSEIINMALDNYFKQLPETKRQQYLNSK